MEIPVLVKIYNFSSEERSKEKKMIFILEDDVSGNQHHIEIEVNKSSSITAEQLLFEFVKFRNIKNPGTNVNVADLCLCSVMGSGKKKRVEKQLLHSSLIDIKKKGSGKEKGKGGADKDRNSDNQTQQFHFKVYGLGGQLEKHREAVDQLRGFKTLVNTLSADIDHFIAADGGGGGGGVIGVKR